MIRNHQLVVFHSCPSSRGKFPMRRTPHQGVWPEICWSSKKPCPFLHHNHRVCNNNPSQCLLSQPLLCSWPTGSPPAGHSPKEELHKPKLHLHTGGNPCSLSSLPMFSEGLAPSCCSLQLCKLFHHVSVIPIFLWIHAELWFLLLPPQAAGLCMLLKLMSLYLSNWFRGVLYPCHPPSLLSTMFSAVSQELFPSLMISRLKHTSPGGSACEQTFSNLALSDQSHLSLTALNPYNRSCVFKSQVPFDDTSCITGYWFAGPAAPSHVFPLHQRLRKHHLGPALHPLSTTEGAIFMAEIRCLDLKHTESRFS